MQIKPKSKAAANGYHNTNIVGHDQQHEVVGVEAVQSVQDGSLQAVKGMLGRSLALGAGKQQRYGGIVVGVLVLRRRCQVGIERGGGGGGGGGGV